MSRADYKTYHIETKFGHLAVHYKGNIHSHRAFVCLHGHIDTALEGQGFRIFDSNDDELKIFLDFRGHGSSIKTKTYPGLSERGEDIDIFIEDIFSRFPNMKNLYFVAISQGATSLLYYLLNDYRYVDKITISFLLGPRLDLADYLKWFRKGITFMQNKSKDSFLKKYKSKGRIRYTQDYINEFYAYDFYGNINKLKSKAIVFRGEHDDILKEDEAYNLLKLNPDFLSYFAIKDAVHHLNREELMEVYEFMLSSANKHEYIDSNRRRKARVNIKRNYIDRYSPIFESISAI